MTSLMNGLRNDTLFRSSCLFSDLVLFMILCYIAVLGTATPVGQTVVAAGILLTAAAFVALCDVTMNRMNRIFGAARA